MVWVAGLQRFRAYGAGARAVQNLSAHRPRSLHAKRLGVRNEVPLWLRPQRVESELPY
jgi:hypothetical protein